MSSDQSNSHNNWILDTGASHHMTSDLQNLSLHSEYDGTEDIMVGDDKTIPIMLETIILCVILQLTLNNKILTFH